MTALDKDLKQIGFDYHDLKKVNAILKKDHINLYRIPRKGWRIHGFFDTNKDKCIGQSVSFYFGLDTLKDIMNNPKEAFIKYIEKKL